MELFFNPAILQFFLQGFEDLYFLEVDGVVYLEFDALGSSLFVNMAATYGSSLLWNSICAALLIWFVKLLRVLFIFCWSFLKAQFQKCEESDNT